LEKYASKVMHEVLESYGIDHENASLFDIMIQKSNLLLQSGTPAFEYHRTDLGKNIRYIGPLLPYHSSKNQKPWNDVRLGKYSHTILITQGTVERDHTKLTIPALEALKDSGHLLIVATGGAQTQELRAAYPQGNIIIEDFIPFDEVMPKVDLYISNGGYGGTLLAIKHGLPMLVAGTHEGKNEINARVGYFRLGINLKTERPTPGQIRMGVTRIFESSEYACNVQRLREEFAQYDPNVLCAQYVLETLKPNIKTIQRISPALPVF
jgi:UDP:flavonoid glycosyltransferase YjiC (YdhE family)